MGITVRYSGEKFGDIKVSDRALMRELGLLAREQIIRRTLSGRDEHGNAFTPYSQGYLQAKAKELGSASPVNLQVSGRMLQGIVITDVTDTSVTLGFSD